MACPLLALSNGTEAVVRGWVCGMRLRFYSWKDPEILHKGRHWSSRVQSEVRQTLATEGPYHWLTPSQLT
jgi:hypothetical protein